MTHSPSKSIQMVFLLNILYSYLNYYFIIKDRFLKDYLIQKDYKFYFFFFKNLIFNNHFILNKYVEDFLYYKIYTFYVSFYKKHLFLNLIINIYLSNFFLYILYFRFIFFFKNIFFFNKKNKYFFFNNFSCFFYKYLTFVFLYYTVEHVLYNDSLYFNSYFFYLVNKNYALYSFFLYRDKINFLLVNLLYNCYISTSSFFTEKIPNTFFLYTKYYLIKYNYSKFDISEYSSNYKNRILLSKKPEFFYIYLFNLVFDYYYIKIFILFLILDFLNITSLIGQYYFKLYKYKNIYKPCHHYTSYQEKYFYKYHYIFEYSSWYDAQMHNTFNVAQNDSIFNSFVDKELLYDDEFNILYQIFPYSSNVLEDAYDVNSEVNSEINSNSDDHYINYTININDTNENHQMNDMNDLNDINYINYMNGISIKDVNKDVNESLQNNLNDYNYMKYFNQLDESDFEFDERNSDINSDINSELDERMNKDDDIDPRIKKNNCIMYEYEKKLMRDEYEKEKGDSTFKEESRYEYELITDAYDE